MTRSRRLGNCGECGSAYLLLMVLVGAFSGLFAIALGTLVPPQAAHRGSAEQRLAWLRTAAADDYLRNGAFAANLPAFAARIAPPPSGSWRLDPYGAAVDFRWRASGQPRTLRVDCRGSDGRLDTADDLTFSLSEQQLGRDRSRDHLRVLRARIVAWQAGAGSTPMSGTDLAALRASSRSYVQARRAYATATTAERVALTATMNSSLATIRGLRSHHGIALPTRVTGGSGLMTAIGWPDSAAVDGWRRTLQWNEAVGVVSVGGDNRRGTDDDF